MCLQHKNGVFAGVGDIFSEGVDSKTQAAIQSDKENFYRPNLSSGSESSECGESDGESDDEWEDFNPHLFQSVIKDRARSVSTGSVKRTASGGAEGVFVLSNDPLYNYVREKVSEPCCEANCLSAFSMDEVYQFQLNLLEMTKEEKSLCMLGKLHDLSIVEKKHHMLVGRARNVSV